MRKFFSLIVASVLSVQGASKIKVLNSSAPIELSQESYLLGALDAQMRHKYTVASNYFETLYAQTGKKKFLYQSLRMLEQSNEISKLSEVTQKELTKTPDDLTLQRFSIIALLKSGQFGHASQEASALCERSKVASDYALSAEAYLKLDEFQNAYSALKKGYALSHDEEMADRLALIQYVHLGEKNEAIEFLKNHIEKYGNSKLLGKRLGSFYGDQGMLDKAAAMFEETYALTSDPLIAQEAIKIYVYQQDFDKLNPLLEKSGANDPMLLELYIRDKKFDKASLLAKKLYKEDQNPLYLAQSSIFSYEASANKSDPILLKEVVDGLKQVNSEIDDPMYLNYLGYLMIEHDLNIAEGMEYVQRALKKQPDSPYYIDSLAWGYYKKGECAQALKLIKQVESMIGSDEQEVKEHIEAIQKCETKEKK
jgi:tetratricopeptide (TPR) repeat protein